MGIPGSAYPKGHTLTRGLREIHFLKLYYEHSSHSLTTQVQPHNSQLGISQLGTTKSSSTHKPAEEVPSHRTRPHLPVPVVC